MRRVNRKDLAGLDGCRQRRTRTAHDTRVRVEDLAASRSAYLSPGARWQKRVGEVLVAPVESVEEQVRRLRARRELLIDATEEIGTRLPIRDTARDRQPDRGEHDEAEQQPHAQRHARSALGRGPQRVANAPNGMDEWRPDLVDLLAQVADVCLDDVRVAFEVVLPHG